MSFILPFLMQYQFMTHLYKEHSILLTLNSQEYFLDSMLDELNFNQLKYAIGKEKGALDEFMNCFYVTKWEMIANRMEIMFHDTPDKEFKKTMRVLNDVVQRRVKRAKTKFNELNEYEISRVLALCLYKREYESLEQFLKLLQTRKDLDLTKCICDYHKHLTGFRGFEMEMNISTVPNKIMVLFAKLCDMDECFGVDFHCNGADEFHTMLIRERKETENENDVAGDAGDRREQGLSGRTHHNNLDSGKEKSCQSESSSFICNMTCTTSAVESQSKLSAHFCVVAGFVLFFFVFFRLLFFVCKNTCMFILTA